MPNTQSPAQTSNRDSSDSTTTAQNSRSTSRPLFSLALLLGLVISCIVSPSPLTTLTTLVQTRLQNPRRLFDTTQLRSVNNAASIRVGSVMSAGAEVAMLPQTKTPVYFLSHGGVGFFFSFVYFLLFLGWVLLCTVHVQYFWVFVIGTEFGGYTSVPYMEVYPLTTSMANIRNTIHQTAKYHVRA